MLDSLSLARSDWGLAARAWRVLLAVCFVPAVADEVHQVVPAHQVGDEDLTLPGAAGAVRVEGPRYSVHNNGHRGRRVRHWRLRLHFQGLGFHLQRTRAWDCGSGMESASQTSAIVSDADGCRLCPDRRAMCARGQRAECSQRWPASGCGAGPRPGRAVPAMRDQTPVPASAPGCRAARTAPGRPATVSRSLETVMCAMARSCWKIYSPLCFSRSTGWKGVPAAVGITRSSHSGLAVLAVASSSRMNPAKASSVAGSSVLLLTTVAVDGQRGHRAAREPAQRPGAWTGGLVSYTRGLVFYTIWVRTVLHAELPRCAVEHRWCWCPCTLPKHRGAQRL